jgi:hypothetical protein
MRRRNADRLKPMLSDEVWKMFAAMFNCLTLCCRMVLESWQSLSWQRSFVSVCSSKIPLRLSQGPPSDPSLSHLNMSSCRSGPTTARWHVEFSRLRVWLWLSSCGIWQTVQTDLRPDDGGSKHLWNVGQFLRDYAAQYSRRLSYFSRLGGELWMKFFWKTGKSPVRITLIRAEGQTKELLVRNGNADHLRETPVLTFVRRNVRSDIMAWLGRCQWKFPGRCK